MNAEKYYMTKAEYLYARNEWKKLYKKISNLIRAEKIALQLMNKGGYSAVMAARAIQSALAYDRMEARDMMEDLDYIKLIGKLSKQYADLGFDPRNTFQV